MCKTLLLFLKPLYGKAPPKLAWSGIRCLLNSFALDKIIGSFYFHTKTHIGNKYFLAIYQCFFKFLTTNK